MLANIYDFGIQNVEKRAKARETRHTLHSYTRTYEQIEMQCGHYNACASFGLSTANGKLYNVAQW